MVGLSLLSVAVLLTAESSAVSAVKLAWPTQTFSELAYSAPALTQYWTFRVEWAILEGQRGWGEGRDKG